MNHLRIAAVLAASSLALTACSGGESIDSPAEEASVAPAAATPTAGGTNGSDDEAASTTDQGSNTPVTEGDASAAPTGGQNVPAVSPQTTAMMFQEGIYEGREAICDLLTPGARKQIVSLNIEQGIIAAGSTCDDYVAEIGDAYRGSEVSVSTFVTEESLDSASVRVEMDIDGAAQQTLMTLRVINSAWRIADWGAH